MFDVTLTNDKYVMEEQFIIQRILGKTEMSLTKMISKPTTKYAYIYIIVL